MKNTMNEMMMNKQELGMVNGGALLSVMLNFPLFMQMAETSSHSSSFSINDAFVKKGDAGRARV